jgi:flagellar export protein FliJ
VNAFCFHLERVLELRRRQLAAEESRFRRQTAALAKLNEARAQLEAAGAAAEREVRAWQPVAGRDLAALAEFRTHVSERERDLGARRVECERELAARQRDMLEARRRCRLLEKLKERRFAEWRAAAEREIEALAAEAFLTRWNQERSP